MYKNRTKSIAYAFTCNIIFFFRNDLNNLTSSNIQLLPNSPTQNGSDSILTFYAILASGATIPKHILGTIFSKQQERILSLPIVVEDLNDILLAVGETVNLTVQQRANSVPLSLKNIPRERVSVKESESAYPC